VGSACAYRAFGGRRPLSPYEPMDRDEPWNVPQSGEEGNGEEVGGGRHDGGASVEADVGDRFEGPGRPGRRGAVLLLGTTQDLTAS